MEESTKEGAGAACNRRILVVDDDKQIRDIFALLLSEEFGCVVDEAEDGAAACRLFDEHHPAVIVMDLHMPVMDGMDAFVEIRKRCEAKGCEMPTVIFCTAYDPPHTLQSILSQDTNHTLVRKPVSNDELIGLVNSHLPQ